MMDFFFSFCLSPCLSWWWCCHRHHGPVPTEGFVDCRYPCGIYIPCEQIVCILHQMHLNLNVWTARNNIEKSGTAEIRK